MAPPLRSTQWRWDVGGAMWERQIRRWGLIPFVFLVVGPPTGALVLQGLTVFVVGPSVALGMLPLVLMLSPFFGGAQAVATGLVAAATVREGRVRAGPPVATAAAIGLLFAAAALVAQEPPPLVGPDGTYDVERAFAEARAETRGSAVVMAPIWAAAHAAAAWTAVRACWWLERWWTRRAGPGTV